MCYENKNLLPLCLFFACYLLFGQPAAYAGDVLERRIEVSFFQTPVKTALDEVARRGGFEWSYNAGILDAAQKITLTARGWTVRETLSQMLGDAYSYRQSGEYLILKKNKNVKPQLKGYITDSQGRKVPNATVYDRKTLRSTTTDTNGYYQLPVTPQSEVVVAKLAYRDTVLQVTSMTPHFIKITLKADTIQPAEDDVWTSVKKDLESAGSDLEQLFTTAAQQFNAANVRDSLHRVFQVSILPVIGTNHVMSGSVVNDYSVNALVGYSRGSQVLEVGGIGNVTRENAYGVQAAGVFNEVAGNVSGFQAAGVYNHVGGTLRGVQAGGLINIAHRGAGGSTQVAGLMNIARSGKFGAQVSGLLNVADTCNGTQVAGLLNMTGHSRNAVQVSGLGNFAGNGATTAQVSGLFNVADTVQGVQISPMFNRASSVKGTQIGLVNVAREIDGVQIGLLGLSRRGGYIVLEAGANDVHTANVTLKTGTKRFYSIFTAGTEPTFGYQAHRLWSYGAGFGFYKNIGRHAGFNVDLIHRHPDLGPFSVKLQTWEQAAVHFDLRITNRLSIAVGPSANLLIVKQPLTDGIDIREAMVRKELPQRKIEEWGTLWMGVHAGVRFKLTK